MNTEQPLVENEIKPSQPIFDPNDARLHKQNKKKCVEILKRGLELAKRKQEEKLNAPQIQQYQQSQLQLKSHEIPTYIKIIESLRSYFPAQNGYNLAKIVHTLHNTLVKKDNQQKIQSQESEKINHPFSNGSKIPYKIISLNQTDILPLPLNLPSHPIQTIAIIRCFSKYPGNSKKVNKFLQKVDNGQKKCLNDEQYSKILRQVMLNTIKWIQNKGLKQKCKKEIDFQKISLQGRLNFVPENMNTAFNQVLNDIKDNKFLLLNGDSENVDRKTFLAVMSFIYGIVDASEANITESQLLNLYLTIANQTFAKFSQKNLINENKIIDENQTPVHSSITLNFNIFKTFFQPQEQADQDLENLQKLSKTVEQAIWVKDNIYESVCKAFLIQTQDDQTFQAKLQKIEKHLLKEYGYNVRGDQNDRQVGQQKLNSAQSKILNVLKKVVVKTLEISWQGISGKPFNDNKIVQIWYKKLKIQTPEPQCLGHFFKNLQSAIQFHRPIDDLSTWILCIKIRQKKSERIQKFVAELQTLGFKIRRDVKFEMVQPLGQSFIVSQIVLNLQSISKILRNYMMK